MRKILNQLMVILFLGLMPLSSRAQVSDANTEQKDSLVLPIYFIDGHFYKKKLPIKVDCIKSFSSVSNGADGKVYVFKMNSSFTAPANWKEYEIPREKVKNLAKIEENIKTFQQMTTLTRYNENTAKLGGKPLPGSFSLYDIDGNLWTEQSLKGKKVVINCWYSGCGPCLREMPILSEWKAKYPDVLFLSANFEKADKVKKIVTERGFNWTHLYGDDYFVKFVGNGGFPLFIVLGEDGLVHYIVNGTNEKIQQDIQEVIQGLDGKNN